MSNERNVNMVNGTTVPFYYQGQFAYTGVLSENGNVLTLNDGSVLYKEGYTP